jgi:Domain of unknown function (DUF3883)
MDEIRDSRYHKNYDLMNLIGYGLAKFDREFVKQFGFNNKTEFYNYVVSIGICGTTGAIKNRQDMLDPLFDNGRKGWHQKSYQYISRKLYIDSFFENEDVISLGNIVKIIINQDFNIPFSELQQVSPVLKSRYRSMQETGTEAELYFYNNYSNELIFKNAIIEDARQWGDGYDFQLQIDDNYLLVEVKGVKEKKGSFRFTEKEVLKAKEYEKNYFLVVVSNLIDSPKISIFDNPLNRFELQREEKPKIEINYYSKSLLW